MLTHEDAFAVGPGRPDRARLRASDYDVRKYFPYSGYETYDFNVPTATEGDVYARYRVRVEEMRQSVKICQAGDPAHLADRASALRRHRARAAAEGQGLHRDGSADSALPDLLAGLHRAGRRCLRAGRRAARRARLLHRVRRHRTGRGASRCGRRRSWRFQALPTIVEGGLIADVVAVIGSTDVVMGDCDR